MFLIKIFFWSLFIYLIIKVYKFVRDVMKSVPANKEKVEKSVEANSKIDKSNIIEAEFEDLPIAENNNETSNEEK